MSAHQFTTIQIAALLDHLCEAVDAAREKAAGNTRWLNAIDSAWGWLLLQEAVQFDPRAHALRVESASEPGKVYVANGDCQCKAFAQHNACWHRAAARLVRRAWEASGAAAHPGPAREAQDAEALAAELYAEAQAAGDAWYTLDIARAGAASRRPGLHTFAREWDRDADSMKRAALAARIGAAQAAAMVRAA